MMPESIGVGTHAEQDVDTANDHGIPEKLHLDIFLIDREVVAEVSHYLEGTPREEFVCHALRIGILALKHARGQIDADSVRRETDRMMERLSAELNQHKNSLNERVTDVLRQYFDPESGQLYESIQRLIKHNGELAELLVHHIGDEDSILCKTLGRHFGEESRPLKWLSPDKSQGFLAEMNGTLEGQLKEQREEVIKQFSLDNKDGALARFIDELTKSHGELTKDLEKKIDEVVKEFSLDEEVSALSRLVKNVSDAEKKIRDEFSLDEENSALARLKRELLKVLEKEA